MSVRSWILYFSPVLNTHFQDHNTNKFFTNQQCDLLIVSLTAELYLWNITELSSYFVLPLPCPAASEWRPPQPGCCDSGRGWGRPRWRAGLRLRAPQSLEPDVAKERVKKKNNNNFDTCHRQSAFLHSEISRGWACRGRWASCPQRRSLFSSGSSSKSAREELVTVQDNRRSVRVPGAEGLNPTSRTLLSTGDDLCSRIALFMRSWMHTLSIFSLNSPAAFFQAL